jgi:hypothetical protein
MAPQIETFGFRPGRKVGARFTIEALIGRGYEGEVYQIRERDTGILRAAKFYFPHRDPKQKTSIRHAQKLNILRHCPIVLQYHHTEIITVRKDRVVALISDLCDGKPLEQWIARHRGKRLAPYLALHVLYHLVRGLENVHAIGQYHSDVHNANILIEPRGVSFDLKLIDFYDWGRSASWKQQQDITDAVNVLYECLGAKRWYADQPPEIKHICAGLKHSLILKRFPTMTVLRQHLDSFPWSKL